MTARLLHPLHERFIGVHVFAEDGPLVAVARVRSLPGVGYDNEVEYRAKWYAKCHAGGVLGRWEIVDGVGDRRAWGESADLFGPGRWIVRVGDLLTGGIDADLLSITFTGNVYVREVVH